jgi:hypothetical protein
MDTDLTLADAEFLQTVRDINDNPAEFGIDDIDAEDAGEVPATKTTIRENSGLSQGQVKHRVDGDGNRLLQDGLLKQHESEIIDPEKFKFTPKSFEVTEKGLQELEAVEGWLSGTDAEVTGALKELESRVEQIEHAEFEGDVDASQVSAELQSLRGSIEDLDQTLGSVTEDIQRIDDELQQIQSSPFGALGEEEAEKLDTALYKLPGVLYLLNAVFDMKAENIVESGSYDEAELEQKQARVFEMLSSAAAEQGMGQPGTRRESDDGVSSGGTAIEDSTGGGSGGATESADGGHPNQSATDGSDSAGGDDGDGDPDSTMSLSQPDIADDSDSE